MIDDLNEIDLINIAENHINDDVSAKAMKELRDRFDSSYFWCQECDGLVVKQKNCCLNKYR